MHLQVFKLGQILFMYLIINPGNIYTLITRDSKGKVVITQYTLLVVELLHHDFESATRQEGNFNYYAKNPEINITVMLHDLLLGLWSTFKICIHD